MREVSNVRGEVAKWYTQSPQKRPSESSCGFESHLPHASMMTATAEPGSGPLRGTVRVPGDETISLAALSVASLARGFSLVSHCSRAPDVVAVRQTLASAGARIQAWIGDGTTISVSRAEPQASAPAVALRSASSLAVLLGRFAAEGAAFAVDLPFLPGCEALVGVLRANGVTIDERDGRITRIVGPVADTVSVAFDSAFAQTLGGLLIASSRPGTRLHVTGVQAASDHVARMLGRLGANLDHASGETKYAAEALSGCEIEIPGDTRAAAFLAAAAAVTAESTLTIESVALSEAGSGMLDALRLLGLRTAFERMIEVGGEPIADIHVTAAPLNAAMFSAELVARCGADWPIAAAVAACASGTTIVQGALVDAAPVVAVLRASGVDAQPIAGGGLRIVGGTVTPPPESYARDGAVASVAAILGSHCGRAGDLAATPIDARFPGIADTWTNARR